MSELRNEINKFLGMFEPVSFNDGTCHMIGAFGNVGVVETNEGLVVFDIATRQFGNQVFKALRRITDKPIKYIIYSHGHFDHCFGFSPFLEEIEKKGWQIPKVIAHENLINRFNKYRMLDDYHNWINSMQFASVGGRQGRATTTKKTLDPTIILKGQESYTFEFGGLNFELFHDMGETDDSIWMFVPEKKSLFTGDLMISGYPNVGNPYKVQRYPHHWAVAMERMLEKEPEYMIPGHGPFVKGREKIRDILSITAEAMHFVHDEMVKRLNQGKWFEEIYNEMLDIYPERLKNHRYLAPVYGCYEFAIHASYRLYHGWYDSGNPTDLFPSKSEDIAEEFLKIADESKYFEHAEKLHQAGNSQLALHVLDVLIKGLENTPNESLLKATQLKHKILKYKADNETSFIAYNIIRNSAKSLKLQIKELEKKIQ